MTLRRFIIALYVLGIICNAETAYFRFNDDNGSAWLNVALGAFCVAGAVIWWRKK